jgi:hypothetical protein
MPVPQTEPTERMQEIAQHLRTTLERTADARRRTERVIAQLREHGGGPSPEGGWRSSR